MDRCTEGIRRILEGDEEGVLLLSALRAKLEEEVHAARRSGPPGPAGEDWPVRRLRESLHALSLELDEECPASLVRWAFLAREGGEVARRILTPLQAA